MNKKIKYTLHPTSTPYFSKIITSDELLKIKDYLKREWAMDSTINQAALDFMTNEDVAHIVPECDLGGHDSLAKASVTTIASYENSKTFKHGGWDKKVKRWFAHKSIEGGTRTIAYGHKITKDEHNSGQIVVEGESFSIENGLIDFLAISLLNQDICMKVIAAKKIINDYSSFPEYVKQAIINGFYRGDLSGSPMTMRLINKGEWIKASKEYLHNREYINPKTMKGIKLRMENNANAFKSYGLELLGGNIL